MDFDGNDFLILVGIAGALFAWRYVNLWYWKIDESLEIQKKQLKLLQKLAGEEVKEEEDK